MSHKGWAIYKQDIPQAPLFAQQLYLILEDPAGLAGPSETSSTEFWADHEGPLPAALAQKDHQIEVPLPAVVPITKEHYYLSLQRNLIPPAWIPNLLLFFFSH